MPNSADLPFCLPGDDVTIHVVGKDVDRNNSKNSQTVVKIGPGLQWNQREDKVYATTAGPLSIGARSSCYFIPSARTGRYEPAVHDRVVGIVEDRMGSDGAGGDVYRIHIGASHPATLSNLQFDGTTKRNKPSLKAGQIVYARVANLHAGRLDPELSCQLSSQEEGQQNLTRRDWMTDEGCYGVLAGGTLVPVSMDLCSQLLQAKQPQHAVWQELSAAQLPCELAVGCNGLVWIHSASPEITILLHNLLQNAAVLTASQTVAMIRQLVTHYRREQHVYEDGDARMDD
jgi:exosome complex component RRP40